MKERVNGLILAAGLSSRMGTFKPLLPLQGKAVIDHTIDHMLLGGAKTIVVVTGYRRDDLTAYLSSRYPRQVVFVDNEAYASTDMLESIRLGCRAMPACGAFFLMPADMPMVSPETFRALVRRRGSTRKTVVFPTLDGHRKHPPLIDFGLIPEILSFSGSEGLRGLWRQLEDRILTVPVRDQGVWIDLDTKQDYHTILKGTKSLCMS
ncbi:MAG: nucleotidyltransferase family protein [Eubacteriales bacterium]|nr:nucleotidyltransferase family protein [Eubacteriales bacterium]